MGASQHPCCGEEVSLPSAALGAVAGGSNSACGYWGCFGARLCDIVGLCLVGDDLLILMLAKLLGVLFVSLK